MSDKKPSYEELLDEREDQRRLLALIRNIVLPDQSQAPWPYIVSLIEENARRLAELETFAERAGKLALATPGMPLSAILGWLESRLESQAHATDKETSADAFKSALLGEDQDVFRERARSLESLTESLAESLRLAESRAEKLSIQARGLTLEIERQNELIVRMTEDAKRTQDQSIRANRYMHQAGAYRRTASALLDAVSTALEAEEYEL